MYCLAAYCAVVSMYVDTLKSRTNRLIVDQMNVRDKKMAIRCNGTNQATEGVWRASWLSGLTVDSRVTLDIFLLVREDSEG